MHHFRPSAHLLGNGNDFRRAARSLKRETKNWVLAVALTKN